MYGAGTFTFVVARGWKLSRRNNTLILILHLCDTSRVSSRYRDMPCRFWFQPTLRAAKLHTFIELVEVYAHLTGALFGQSIAVPTEYGAISASCWTVPLVCLLFCAVTASLNATMRAVLIPLRLR